MGHGEDGDSRQSSENEQLREPTEGGRAAEQREKLRNREQLRERRPARTSCSAARMASGAEPLTEVLAHALARDGPRSSRHVPESEAPEYPLKTWGGIDDLMLSLRQCWQPLRLEQQLQLLIEAQCSLRRAVRNRRTFRIW